LCKITNARVPDGSRAFCVEKERRIKILWPPGPGKKYLKKAKKSY